jgi:hypothetical protein
MPNCFVHTPCGGSNSYTGAEFWSEIKFRITEKKFTIFRLDSAVVQNQNNLYQLNSWQIAEMPFRFVTGFPVTAHSDVLLSERSCSWQQCDCFTDSGPDGLGNSITPSTVPQLKAGIHALNTCDIITLQYYLGGITSYVTVFSTRYMIKQDALLARILVTAGQDRILAGR